MLETRFVTPITPPKHPIRTLAAFRQLPILPGTRESVLASLHRRNATAVSVAVSCQHDPILQLQLWLTVNETLQSSGNELHHLAHGISLLGLPKTEDIVRNAPQMITPNGGYLECLMQSVMSERIAQTLMISEISEHERWGMTTLFARCHEWSLWHHFPNHMIQRQGLLANAELNATEQASHDIEVRLFGQSIQELGTQLSQELALPQPLKHAWSLDWEVLSDAAQACIDDELRHWIQENPDKESHFFGRHSKIWLINRLSQELAEHANAESCQQIMTILARQSMKSEDAIMFLAHQAMVSAATPLSEWPHPANRLIQNWNAKAVIEPLAIRPLKEKAQRQGEPFETLEARQPQTIRNAQSSSTTEDDSDDAVQKTLTAFRELAQVDENGDVADIPMPTSTASSTLTTKPTPEKEHSARSTMPDFLQLPSERETASIATATDNQRIAPQDNPDSPQYQNPKADAPLPPPFRNSTLLDDHLKRLLERGDQFSNLNQLLLFAVDTLAEGVGLERVVMMIIHNKNSLRSHYWRGLDQDDPLRKLAIALDGDTQRGIIGQLFKQPAGLNITSANAALVQSRSPAILAPLLEENTTALMSLFHDQTPIAIVYCSTSNFEAKQFQQFKRVCNATSKAISAFAQRKYRRTQAGETKPSKAAQ